MDTSIMRADRQSAATLITEAQSIAEVWDDLLVSRKLSIGISGRKYVKVEGWTSLSAFFGLDPIISETLERDDGEIEACCELQQLGRVVVSASASCHPDEVMKRKNDGKYIHRWREGCPGHEHPAESCEGPVSRYAVRSMAQTRAVSKACRIKLGWVVALAGYDTTPWEEMEAVVVNGKVVNETKESVIDLRSAKEKKENGRFGKILELQKKCGLSKEELRKVSLATFPDWDGKELTDDQISTLETVLSGLSEKSLEIEIGKEGEFTIKDPKKTKEKK